MVSLSRTIPGVWTLAIRWTSRRRRRRMRFTITFDRLAHRLAYWSGWRWRTYSDSIGHVTRHKWLWWHGGVECLDRWQLWQASMRKRWGRSRNYS